MISTMLGMGSARACLSGMRYSQQRQIELASSLGHTLSTMPSSAQQSSPLFSCSGTPCIIPVDIHSITAAAHDSSSTCLSPWSQHLTIRMPQEAQAALTVSASRSANTCIVFKTVIYVLWMIVILVRFCIEMLIVCKVCHNITCHA